MNHVSLYPGSYKLLFLYSCIICGVCRTSAPGLHNLNLRIAIPGWILAPPPETICLESIWHLLEASRKDHMACPSRISHPRVAQKGRWQWRSLAIQIKNVSIQNIYTSYNIFGNLLKPYIIPDCFLWYQKFILCLL